MNDVCRSMGDESAQFLFCDGCERNKTRVGIMNEITIRNLDNACIKRLRQLAWQDGRSMEEIARSLILEGAQTREVKRRDARFPVPTD